MDVGASRAISLLQQENQRLKEEVTFLREENEALQGYLRGMVNLVEAAQTIISQDNLLVILDDLLYYALILGDADHGSIMLLDEESNELVFIMVHGDFRDSLQGYRIKADQGIAGWVATHGEAMIVNNTRVDQRFSSEVDLNFGLQTQSLIAAPLQYGEKRLGVLELVNKRNKADFTEDDSTLVTLLGTFAAMALDRVNQQLELAEQMTPPAAK